MGGCLAVQRDTAFLEGFCRLELPGVVFDLCLEREWGGGGGGKQRLNVLYILLLLFHHHFHMIEYFKKYYILTLL